jgi:hypothetical protein
MPITSARVSGEAGDAHQSFLGSEPVRTTGRPTVRWAASAKVSAPAEPEPTERRPRLDDFLLELGDPDLARWVASASRKMRSIDASPTLFLELGLFLGLARILGVPGAKGADASLLSSLEASVRRADRVASAAETVSVRFPRRITKSPFVRTTCGAR